jgi:hypothetical protein
LKDFRDLKGWEKSHNLALLVYQHTRPFHEPEMFSLARPRALGSGGSE